MEIFELVVTLVGHIAWPVVFLVLIFRFSPSLNMFVSNMARHLGVERNLRAKFGSIEIESSTLKIEKSDLEKIATEKDEKKRLELYRKKIEAEDALDDMSQSDKEWLIKFGKNYNIPNAFVVWPHGSEAPDEIKAFNKLVELGLVKESNVPLYGGEWIGAVTEQGKNIIRLIESDDGKKA